MSETVQARYTRICLHQLCFTPESAASCRYPVLRRNTMSTPEASGVGAPSLISSSSVSLRKMRGICSVEAPIFRVSMVSAMLRGVWPKSSSVSSLPPFETRYEITSFSP